MKTLILSFLKTLLLVFSIELIIFILMIFFLMTDQAVGIVGKSLGAIVKYVLGFPLVLFNREYPFFLNNPNPPNYMFPLMFVNLLIQTGIIFFIRKLIK